MSRPSPATVLAVVAVVTALGGVGVAAIPDTSGVIHTCYDPTTGALRDGDPAGGPPRPCQPATEKLVDIDTTPPAGPRGPAGPPGSSVDAGDAALPATLPKVLTKPVQAPTRKRRRLLRRRGVQGEPTKAYTVFRNGPLRCRSRQIRAPRSPASNSPAGSTS